MRYLISICFLVCFCLFLSCEKFSPEVAKGVKQIKSNLGDYQYMNLDPQLSFEIKKVSFKKAYSYLDYPEVNYTVNVKQNNLNFPVKEYDFTVYFGIYYNEEELYEFWGGGEISDKMTSIADVHALYGFKPKSFAGLKVKVKSYNWNPIRKFEPYEE